MLSYYCRSGRLLPNAHSSIPILKGRGAFRGSAARSQYWLHKLLAAPRCAGTVNKGSRQGKIAIPILQPCLENKSYENSPNPGFLPSNRWDRSFNFRLPSTSHYDLARRRIMKPSSLATAWFAAYAIANPITRPPAATVTEAPNLTHILDCYDQYVSLFIDWPNVGSYSQVVPWFVSEISKVVATATIALNKCDRNVIFRSATITKSPQVAAEWSKGQNDHSSWVSQYNATVASLASSCTMYGLSFELLAVTDKAGCESAYRKYGQSIPPLSLPPATFLDRYRQNTATPTPASPGTSASKATATAVPPLRIENGGRAAKGNGVAIAAAAAAVVAGGVALL